MISVNRWRLFAVDLFRRAGTPPAHARKSSTYPFSWAL